MKKKFKISYNNSIMKIKTENKRKFGILQNIENWMLMILSVESYQGIWYTIHIYRNLIANISRNSWGKKLMEVEKVVLFSLNKMSQLLQDNESDYI